MLIRVFLVLSFSATSQNAVSCAAALPPKFGLLLSIWPPQLTCCLFISQRKFPGAEFHHGVAAQCSFTAFWKLPSFCARKALHCFTMPLQINDDSSETPCFKTWGLSWQNNCIITIKNTLNSNHKVFFLVSQPHWCPNVRIWLDSWNTNRKTISKQCLLAT